MPEFGQNRLHHERRGMKVFRRAFRQAMRASEDPSGTFPTMAEALEAFLAAPTTDPEIGLAFAEVVQFERLHPDMIAFGAAAGLGDAELDALFRVAMAIEAAGSAP